MNFFVLIDVDRVYLIITVCTMLLLIQQLVL